MHDESTPTPEPRAQQEPLIQGRRPGRPRGKKDSKPRKRRSDLPTEDPATVAAKEERYEETSWAERGWHWEGASRTPTEPPTIRRRRKTERKPLVLAGHGVRLRVHQGSLVVQNGFTHYPQKREEHRLFPGDRRLPSRIIALDSDGSISLDVIKWLSQQDIPLVLLSWQGEVVSVIGDGGAYDPELRDAQVAAKRSGLGLQISIQLIEEKIVGSIQTLRILPYFLVRDTAIDKLEAILQELQTSPPESIRELLLLEAWGAHAYFSCWHMLPLRWKGLGRKPIPPEWHYVGTRRSLFGSRNRNATHPVNAILNYAYAVLESQMRIATISLGLDPTIGYLHTSRPKRVALVYDLMEPLRPQVDRTLLSFVHSHTFSPSDFMLRDDGVCRLHPQLVRHVTKLTTSDVLVRCGQECSDLRVPNVPHRCSLQGDSGSHFD